MNMNRGFGLRAAIVVSLHLAVACSDDGNPDGRPSCKVDSDCSKDSSMRCGYDGDCYETWACLGTNDWPTKVTPFHVQTEVRDVTPEVSGSPNPPATDIKR
jgi:hypothetical protein